MSNVIKSRKAAVIGCGFVGSATAFTLMQSKLFSELVLLDVNTGKADGEAKDISHGVPFAAPMKIYAGDYDDVADAAIIIVTAGANQKPDETRLDLVHRNVEIYKSIIPEIASRNFGGILLIVSNPVDILTYVALRLSGLPENRVIGSGTVLDTARMKYALGEHLRVDSRSVHSYIVGEHGDSEIAVLSSTNISGIPLDTFCEMRGYDNPKMKLDEIAESVKNSAYDIIAKKQATYYGIAMSVRRICACIIRNERSILPVSSMMHGEYGIRDIALSMPADARRIRHPRHRSEHARGAGPGRRGNPCADLPERRRNDPADPVGGDAEGDCGGAGAVGNETTGLLPDGTAGTTIEGTGRSCCCLHDAGWQQDFLREKILLFAIDKLETKMYHKIIKQSK